MPRLWPALKRIHRNLLDMVAEAHLESHIKPSLWIQPLCMLFKITYWFCSQWTFLKFTNCWPWVKTKQNKKRLLKKKNQFHWTLSNYLDVRKSQSYPRKSVAAFCHADCLFQSLGSPEAGGVVLFHNKGTCCQEGHFPSACDSNTSARSRCRSLLCTKIRALPQMAQLHPLKCFSLSAIAVAPH